MTNTMSMLTQRLTLGVPLLILLLSVTLLLGPWGQLDPLLYTGITYDLLLTAPLAFFVLNRKAGLPRFWGAVFASTGVLVASQTLPLEHRTHFDFLVHGVFPFVELGIIAYMLYWVRQQAKSLSQAAQKHTDPYELIAQGVQQHFGDGVFSRILHGELALFYFLWPSAKPKSPLTLHQKSSAPLMLWGLVAMSLVEMSLVHVVLSLWSHVLAWVLTLFSAYALLWIIAHIRALARRPHVIQHNKLVLKNGLFATVAIPLADIESFGPEKRAPAQAFHVDLLGPMAGQNFVIKTRQEHTVSLAYGFTKMSDTFAFWVDDPHYLVSLLDAERPVSS